MVRQLEHSRSRLGPTIHLIRTATPPIHLILPKETFAKLLSRLLGEDWNGGGKGFMAGHLALSFI